MSSKQLFQESLDHEWLRRAHSGRNAELAAAKSCLEDTLALLLLLLLLLLFAKLLPLPLCLDLSRWSYDEE
jgi:hypothetical protein